MPLRKRIAIPLPPQTSGGGAPPTVGNLMIGPDFGEKSGSDGTTHYVQAGIDLDSVDLTGNLAATGAIDLDAIDLTGDLASSQAIDLDAVDLVGNLGAQGTLVTQVTVADKSADEDTYLDENTPDTTYGSSTSLLSKTSSAPGNNEQVTYIAWDFTWLSGSVDSATVKILSSTSAPLGENINVSIRTSGTKPIEEDTATWNNSEPPSGVERQTYSQAINTSNTNISITLNTTTRANMPGNWLFLRIPGTGLLGTSTITTNSKEKAGTSFKPRMDYTVTL